MPSGARCEGCQAPITFARILSTGNQMPLNQTPDPHGNVAVRMSGQSKIGRVITTGAPLDADEHLYMPHWASCPKRRKTEPEPDVASPPDHHAAPQQLTLTD